MTGFGFGLTTNWNLMVVVAPDDGGVVVRLIMRSSVVDGASQHAFAVLLEPVAQVAPLSRKVGSTSEVVDASTEYPKPAVFGPTKKLKVGVTVAE
jgi:hypothetical protein